MQKVFFVIPGFKMGPNSRMFQWLFAYLESKKYKVVKVPVQWNYRTLTQNAEEFEKFFAKHKEGENYVLGFSYGAVIALLTANTLKPKKIYVCSLSPDFDEDRSAMGKWEKKYIGKKRVEDTKVRSAKKLARELKVPSVLFYGEREAKRYPQLKVRCVETVKLAKHSKLVVVKGAEHDIADPEYQKAIKAVIA